MEGRKAGRQEGRKAGRQEAGRVAAERGDAEIKQRQRKIRWIRWMDGWMGGRVTVERGDKMNKTDKMDG